MNVGNRTLELQWTEVVFFLNSESRNMYSDTVQWTQNCDKNYKMHVDIIHKKQAWNLGFFQDLEKYYY
jgi:hypothetical protein